MKQYILLSSLFLSLLAGHSFAMDEESFEEPSFEEPNFNCQAQIEKATENVPAILVPQKNLWQSGAHAVAQAALFNKAEGKRFSYDNFLKNSPVSAGQPHSKSGYGWCAAAGICGLAILSDGVSSFSEFGVASSLVMGAVTPFIVEQVQKYKGMGKVAPLPQWLAKYGQENTKLKGMELVARRYDDEDSLARGMFSALENDQAVVVLLGDSYKNMRYVMVYPSNNNNFNVLDTNNQVKQMSQEQLFLAMDLSKDNITNYAQKVFGAVGSWFNGEVGRFNMIKWQPVLP